MDHSRLITEPADEISSPAPGTRPARHTRKLFDKVLVAFHHACDVGDLDVAERLLPVMEMMTTRRQTTEDITRRRSIEGLVAAHERLWHLRHPTIR